MQLFRNLSNKKNTILFQRIEPVGKTLPIIIRTAKKCRTVKKDSKNFFLKIDFKMLINHSIFEKFGVNTVLSYYDLVLNNYFYSGPRLVFFLLPVYDIFDAHYPFTK